MPPHVALGHFENLLGGEITQPLFRAQIIDDRIMKPQNGKGI
ncbi:MAG TPA: hypothetical protein VFR79_10910 [Nitrospira sp.]|nr:hypothetical protein [Nitrospira sp.]